MDLVLDSMFLRFAMSRSSLRTPARMVALHFRTCSRGSGLTKRDFMVSMIGSGNDRIVSCDVGVL